MNQLLMPHHAATQDWRAAPAAQGMSLADVDTPALLVDLDAMEHNIAAVHARVRASGIAIRPHGKAHKSPDIALRQLDAGAVGLCCQKASEAEEFIQCGIQDVLITNQIVGPLKTARVARLAAQARIGVCVDHAIQIHDMAAAVRREGASLDMLVEMDIGQGRCGVRSAKEVLALASTIEQYRPHLRFAGLHAYHGSLQHMRDPAVRASTVAANAAKVRETVEFLSAAGFACKTVTGGGTGSYFLEADSGVYTEVQPGTYALMDADYACNQLDPAAPVLQQALFGLCTVISVCASHAVIDGGLKAFATDSGLPRMLQAGWTVKSVSDEHIVIEPGPDAAPVAIGDKLRLIPGHCDPTINLHDWLVAYRSSTVEDLWPVSARGALF